MKKITLIISCVLWFHQIIAQNAVPDAANLARFKKSTTYVVLDQSMFGTVYNQKIQEAMNLHWKITPFEFINEAQYQKQMTNPNSSFLAKTEVSFKNDKQKIPYEFLNLMMGATSGHVTQMPDIANFPLAYAKSSDENYSYKIGMILIFLQNHIKIVAENPSLTEKNIIKYYNQNRTKIHDKILYVLENDLTASVNSVDEIKKIYPFEVLIVEKVDIENAINKKMENVVFFHVVKPEKESPKKERCYKLIMGAGDAHLYYWSMDVISEKKPAGVLSDDFKSISK